MFLYRNEAAFSKALVASMRKAGWFVQRIESGETGKGIPDIYAISPTGMPVWLELKRVHHDISPMEVIPWRPGQQAWLHGAVMRKQLAFTLCCFNNCILQIPHEVIYKDNTVWTGGRCVRHYSLRSIIQ